MAQSSGGGIIKWGLIAVAAWYVYENYFATSSTPAPTAAPPNPNAITGANTLAGVFTRLQAAAPAGNHGVDAWNAYLTSVMPSGFVAPDPMPIFTAAVPGFDRSQNITAAQYWAVMSPWLKTNQGLSGVNHYAGLAAVYGFGRLA